MTDPGGYYEDGFAPTAGNYRFFALTPNGIALGFVNGQVAIANCGRIEVTVPYSVVRPILSALGKQLVAGVRAPG